MNQIGTPKQLKLNLFASLVGADPEGVLVEVINNLPVIAPPCSLPPAHLTAFCNDHDVRDLAKPKLGLI